MTAKLTDALFTTFVRLDGMRVKGFLTTSPSASTKDRAPYRILTVRNPCLVDSGDTLFGSSPGEKLILLDHPSDLDYARSFKVAYARRAYPWERRVGDTDPVTGLKRSNGGYTPMGLVYANLDTPVDMTTLGFSETEYRFITGQPVQHKDRVAGKEVYKIDEILGARLVYAK